MTSSAALERIRTAWELSPAELASLFRVPFSTMTTWLDAGVPAVRRGDVAAVLDVVTRVEQRAGGTRVVDLVRHPLPRLDGRSIIDATREDPRSASLLVTSAVDWSRLR